MSNFNFDFHCHPFGKHFLSAERLEKKRSPNKKIKGGILQFISPVIASQSSLGQLKKGNVKLSVCGVVPIERGFSKLMLIKDLVGTFSVLDKKFIKNINHGDYYSYHDLLQDELTFIHNHCQNTGDEDVKVLSSIEDFRADRSHNLILAIEGSHSFFERSFGYEKSLAVKAKHYEKGSFLYLTFTHLSTNDLCNHAYGAKITESNTFKPNLRTKGISQDGLELIDICYDTTSGKRILIDIKHMSIGARRQFYQYRKDKGYDNIPILATHMGSCGLSYADFLGNIETKNRIKELPDLISINHKEIRGICSDRKSKNETKFNPWSINLFDDEITEIVNSDGLIGLSLDQRILGFSKEENEIMRLDEFGELTGLSNSELEKIPLIDLSEFGSPVDSSSELNPIDLSSVGLNLFGRKRTHLRYMCNNILRMVKAGGAKVWDHLVLGSDYDGLINAVNNCKNSSKFPELEKDLRKMLPIMAAEDPNTDYHLEDVEARVRGLMWENAKRFLEKYYTADYLNTGIITT